MRALLIAILVLQVAWADYVPSAQEQDKAAVFGYMIRRRRAEMSGFPLVELVQRSAYPWTLAGLLLPLYLWSAARRSKSSA